MGSSHGHVAMRMAHEPTPSSPTRGAPSNVAELSSPPGRGEEVGWFVESLVERTRFQELERPLPGSRRLDLVPFVAFAVRILGRAPAPLPGAIGLLDAAIGRAGAPAFVFNTD